MKRFWVIHISNLPSDNLLICWETREAIQKLLFDGPWDVNGIIRQLALWQLFFELAFMKLSIDVICLQLHNLPMDLWDGDSLEMIASYISRLLKVDDYASSLHRSKFARICVEIDLANPLKQGLWIGVDAHQVFAVVLYEKLPTFCYTCGLVSHRSNSCNRWSSTCQGRPSLSLNSDPSAEISS